jgi:molybdate transport system substrate-binding protein
LAVALAIVATLGLAGCGGGGPTGASGVLTILAPPSLTEAIGAMAHAFTTAHPGVQIQTVFEADSRIPDRAAQSPAPDVVAAESPATLTAAGATGEPVHFAQGQLVLAVPSSNPAMLRSLPDLAAADVRVALCEPVQPCGEIAAEVLAAAAITLGDGALFEPDVRSALRRVTDGDADVALVYRSDAAIAGPAVITIEVPQSSVALADFVATVPPSAPNPAVAQAFLDYLASAPVRDALTRDGFRPPA